MSQQVFRFYPSFCQVISSNELRILRGQVALLSALLNSSDYCATIDDATTDLERTFNDGGKWRGAIPLGLLRAGLITEAGAATSQRPSRHAGLIHVWRLIDRGEAEKYLQRLNQTIQRIKNPQSAATDAGDESNRRQSADSDESLSDQKDGEQ